MLVHLKGRKNIYEEIVEEYERYIRTGALREGEKLPSCRALAGDLGINPNTVERAYAELERRGLVRMLPKKGAFVSHAGGGKSALLEEAAHRLRILRGAGLTKSELLSLADEIFGGNKEDNDDRT